MMIRPGQLRATGEALTLLRKPKLAAFLLEALLLAPLLYMIAASFFFAQTDPDYWWHVRTGRLIWESGHIPTADPFSFTAANHPWITQEWLTELLFFLVAKSFGY